MTMRLQKRAGSAVRMTKRMRLRRGLSKESAEFTSTSTTLSTAPAATDKFMYTPKFRRHFVDFFPGDTLMRLRLAMKRWNAAADVLIDEGVRSGEFMVQDGNDKSEDAARARRERGVST